MKSWPKRFLSLTLAASAFGFGYLGYNYTQNRSFALAEEKREDVRAGLAHAEDLATAFRSVGKVVEPSVVNIQVKKKSAVSTNRRSRLDDLRRFFRNRDGLPDLPDGLEVPDEGDTDFFDQ